MNEVLSTVLHTRVGQVEGGQLDVRVLVGNSSFERAHCLLGWNCLASDQVCNLQVKGNVLQTA